MNDRVASCLLIAKVLVADGIMADPEKTFLSRAMEAFGLSDDEKRRVRELDGFDEAEQWARKLPEDQKRVLVDRLLEAALVDGKLSPHETKTVAALTAALGLA